ncbi:small heat shock protein OV25-1-like [Daphnia pulicaria]|uniref:small heat shock protein OV25-1-like n=1 Tax=Daphnia pulicaria TaxID=35523 RepID=UPI001EEC2F6D|nr:small heat shock protein OV25-1-like [Daphnia pulicaria]
MDLWCYDPSSDYCCMGRPCPWRDSWRCFQPEPLFRWADTSPLHSLLSHGFLPSTPAGRTSGAVREVECDKDKYQVTLNLGNFKSNEINVKLVDQTLVVCAEHDEKPDESGHIFRRLKRRYYLPPNVDFDNLNATLSDNGTLVVCAQRKAIEAGNEREIEVKKLPAESKSQPQVSEKTEQVTAGTEKCPEKCQEKCAEQETGKEKSGKSTNIPVGREVGDKK